MARARGSRSEMAIAFESVYGTAAAGDYIRAAYASTTLGSQQPLLEDELLGYGRDPLAPIKDAESSDGDIVVPLCTRQFGYWLKGCFGNPVTTGAGPTYTHEFRSGEWTLPSMTVQKALPDVPHFERYTGVMVNQLSWTMQRSGQVTASLALIAQGQTVDTASFLATPAADVEVERFGAFNGSVRRNGAALGSVVSTEITYMNNLDRIEVIRSDGRIDGLDPSKAMLQGSTVVRFADQTLFQQAINGTSCELEFSYVLVGKSMTFTAHSVYLPKPRVEIPGPQGVQVTFAWQAAQDPALGRMCTVELINDVVEYI